jgi:hypothetical protein
VDYRYILKRWTKDARRRVYKLGQEEPVAQQAEGTEAEQAYKNRAMQYAHNLVIKSQEVEESRKIFWDTLEGGEKALDIFFEMRNLSAQQPLRDKDGNKIDRRKKKYRQESISSNSSYIKAPVPLLFNCAKMWFAFEVEYMLHQKCSLVDKNDWCCCKITFFN